MTDGVDVDKPAQKPPRFAELLRIRAFRVLFLAELQSDVGDQLARVALTVLVFARTGNAAATAATYAVTLLPAIAGGYLLGGLGDKWSKRLVMVSADLIRAALFAAMAVPGTPLWALFVLLVVAVFLGPAFSAAEVSYLANTLEPEAYRAATGMRMIAGQASQVGGFALGGAIVAVIQPRGALLIDAATFVLSAAIIAAGLARGSRSSGSAGTRAAEPAWSGSGEPPARWASPRIRRLLALSCLAGFFVAPEGLAVPFASQTGAKTAVAGLLFAAMPLGGVIGALLVRRIRPDRRFPAAGAMALLCGLPLCVTGLWPSWPVALACWTVSGLLAAYEIEVLSQIAQMVAQEVRSRAMGIVGSILLTAQGIGLVLVGLVARWLNASAAVGLAGLVGFALAAVCVPLREIGRLSQGKRIGYAAQHSR